MNENLEVAIDRVVDAAKEVAEANQSGFGIRAANVRLLNARAELENEIQEAINKTK